MDQEAAKLLTKSSIDSIRRVRQFFAATLILSALSVVASYNLYLSWLRQFAISSTISSNAAIASNQMELMKNWVESTFISIPVLGIKIHISDASLAGSIAIFFFMLATLYAMRKQNHSIGQTARRVSATSKLDLVRYVYYGISSEMIFNPLTRNDRPIEDLDDPNEQSTGGRIMGIREAISVLYFVPFAAIVINFFWDVVSIFWWHSPFRENFDTVGEVIKTNYYAIALAASMLIVSALLALVTLYLGHKCKEYQRANGKVLRLLAARIDELDTET